VPRKRTVVSRLFNYSGSAQENRLGELQAERACRLEVNHQLEHGRLFEWRLAKLSSFKYEIGENRGIAEVRLASVQYAADTP